MKNCDACGAENPDGAAFCSLCLARFDLPAHPVLKAEPSAITAQALGQSGLTVQGHAIPRKSPGAEGYVSPGDYHSLRRKESIAHVASDWRSSAYYQAAMGSPGEVLSVAPLPPGVTRRDRARIAISILKNSFFLLILSIAVGFILGILVVGLVINNPDSGVWLATALIIAAQAMLLFWGGFRTSREILERGKGWLYGMACVAVLIFFWQPLFALFISLVLSDRLVLPQTYSLEIIFVAIFLYLPLGAFGGWAAEKRYLG